MKKGIIILIIALVIVFYFSKNSKPVRKTLDTIQSMFGASEAKDALLKIAGTYGKEMASNIERIMRLETAHFTSGQYQKTGTAGMVVGKWSGLPANLPTVHYTVKGKDYEYYVWNVYDFTNYLAKYIIKNNGNWARWNSTNPVTQENYRKLVGGVTNKFIV